MDRHTIIIFVTDLRQQYISYFLPGGTSEWFLNEEHLCKLAKMIRTANWIVLPTPVMKIDKLLYVKEIIQENLIIKKEEDVVKDAIVFGGKFSKEWKDFFAKHEIRYVDFMEQEPVILKNAQVTAEATIAELLKLSNYSISDEKYIVTGYGKCGKAIAQKLACLGAKVTVLARSSTARKQAKADGFCATDFSYGPEEVYGTRGIINTVPAMVVTEPIIKEMHKDSVIIDIASKPGGVDLAAASKYEIPVKSALGLPGIYTTKTSAKILADTMLSYALPRQNENSGKKEEKSWIFQIII